MEFLFKGIRTPFRGLCLLGDVRLVRTKHASEKRANTAKKLLRLLFAMPIVGVSR